MCDAGWCVTGRFEDPSCCWLLAFRRALTVPASCGRSSGARCSAGQSSSCSFVYGCYRDTNTVEGERGEWDVSG